MNVEPSREPEVFWHYWRMPTGLSREEAIAYFKDEVAPKGYTFERFQYNPHRGIVRTL